MTKNKELSVATADRSSFLQKIRNSSLKGDFIIDGLAVIAMFFFVSLSLTLPFPVTAFAILCFSAAYTFLKRGHLGAAVDYFRGAKVEVQIVLVCYIGILLSFFVHAISSYPANPLVKSAMFKALAFNVYAFIFLIEIKKDNIEKFLFKFCRVTAISAAIISVFSLVKLILAFRGITLQTDVVVSEWELFLSSLVADYNFFSLGILAGVFSVVHLWQKGFHFSKIAFSLMLFTIYFSASRRAFLICLLLSLYFLFATSFDKRGCFVKFKFLKVTALGILIGVGWFFIPGALQKNFSAQSKRNFIETFGMDFDLVSTHLPLARFRYLTLLDKNTSLSDLTKEFHKGTDNLFVIEPNFLSSIPNLFTDLVRLLSFENLDHNNDAGEVRKKMFFDFNEIGFGFQSGFDPSDGNRVVRWKFAIEEFKGYSPLEKLLGVGPEYHLSFASNFLNPTSSAEAYDYPHNPFLSILLYSGIFITGGFVLVYLAGLSFVHLPSAITLGLFPTAHFFNFGSLDLLWSNYHFPFMLIFAFKALELSRFTVFGSKRSLE